MLFAKDLLVVRTEDNLPVRTILTFYGQPVVRVWADQRLDAIFNGNNIQSTLVRIALLMITNSQISKAASAIWHSCKV